jgi:TPR repeat protein
MRNIVSVLALSLCLAVPAFAQNPPFPMVNNGPIQPAAVLSAAERGDVGAQFFLGVMYANGRLGVVRDDAQAVAWYRKAAEQGNALAQNNLGEMYKNGRGVPKDDMQAAAWYRKAAYQGDALAQGNLAMLGSVQNAPTLANEEQLAAIFRDTRAAAERGDATAQYSLAGMYSEGLGVAQDDAQAVAWFRKAAEQGNADAQANLGAMYNTGRGVAQDYMQAAAWLLKAAEQGHTIATGLLAAAIDDLRRMHEQGRDVAKQPPSESAGCAPEDVDKKRADLRTAIVAYGEKHPDKAAEIQTKLVDSMRKYPSNDTCKNLDAMIAAMK